MEAEIGAVKTGQVTYAVRDTAIDDKEIKQGDYMALAIPVFFRLAVSLRPRASDVK